ncbi:DUF3566 domain-containing protein [Gordonia sp. HY002]|uniref:DUF3566 domain-containing protein n=1 Tax=Gordonia zhenghanii TaxID=2911516 RepID=UPI001EF08672|nr:DUF3566 domain-containing protein [Gordonia zhenghanii]MCF8571696.1 DUF3566 domain-containing protein [Gordonia zhenghanii]MCF8602720.1 DUF3566 domain-containing protein [Gordonia zhenghanii]
MSTPDDQNVERGQVVPPWKRGEKTSSTGKTAGEIAKAAGVDTGSRPAAGPAPRGVVSSTPSASANNGPASSSAPTPSAPPAPPSAGQGSAGPGSAGQGAGGSGAGSSGPNPVSQSQPAQGEPGKNQPSQSKPGPNKPGPSQPSPNQPGPQPGPARPSNQGSVPASNRPQSSSAALAAAAGSAGGPQQPSPPQPGAQPGGPTESKPFVESDTRNIPRNDLAKKDELPDLDAIHHVEASREAKAAARAQSLTIPSRSGVGVPLRAAVQIRRVDPWSVFKVVGVLAIVGFFIWMIAVAVLYGVLGGMGVWDQINSSFGTLVEGEGQSTGDLIGTGMVFGFSAVFGIIGAILITGIATISAYIYNVCADMVGGFEVTLADLD